MKRAKMKRALSCFCLVSDHSVIQSAVEQARMKIFIPNRDKLNEILLESQEQKKEQATALAAAQAKLRPGLDRFELESIHRSIDELQAAMAASTMEKVKLKRSQVSYMHYTTFSDTVVKFSASSVLSWCYFSPQCQDKRHKTA